MASPSWARISAASRASGSPDTLAEVVGSGPTAAASARGAAWSGTRSPIVGAPPVSAAGSGDVRPLRDDDRQPARPARLAERRRRRRP